ncbi:MAG: cbb3-type cytochrome c oxidase subunit I, partial [Acidovorax sp.]
RTVRRLGVPDVFIPADVDPAVAEVVSAAVDDLAMLGYEIVPVEVPGATSAQDVVYTAIYHDAARIHRERLDSRPDLFHPATLERISLGRGISEAERRNAADARRRFCDGLAPLFEDVDVVLTPTMPVDVPTIDGGDDVLAQSRRMGQFTYPWSLHEGPTLAVPVHFHYVLVAGSLFSMFAGVYYWLPKWTGHMYSETRGQIHFWGSLITFNITFFPMHFLGLAGMPRRYADYPMQFADFNAIASVGAFGFGLMQVYFFLAIVLPAMMGKGAAAPAKPWDGAEGLEWEVPSPAPFHTFETPPKLDATATRVIG